MKKNERRTDYDVVVTPSLAKIWLEKMVANRNPTKTRIESYAASMTAGQWKSGTGETIKFNDIGELVDGQNRLNAVILSDKAIKFDVHYGVDNKVFDVLDTGRSRTAGDVFSIAGVHSSTLTAAIISSYHFLKSGISSKAGKPYRLTNSQTLDIYRTDKGFWDLTSSLSLKWYAEFSRVITPSILGATFAHIYFAQTEISRQSVTNYFQELSSGATSKTYILFLRNKFISDRVSGRLISKEEKCGLIIKAWNIYAKGKEQKRVFFDTDKETTPVPVCANVLLLN